MNIVSRSVLPAAPHRDALTIEGGTRRDPSMSRPPLHEPGSTARPVGAAGTWVIGTERRKLVERRTSTPGETVEDEVLSIPVEPFHAVRPGTTDPIALCGAEVRLRFEEMEFGTRAQNCRRCQAALESGPPD